MKISTAAIGGILTLRYNPANRPLIPKLTWKDFTQKPSENQAEYIEKRLTRTISEYLKKSRQKKVSIALSGGMDSALVLLMLRQSAPDIDIEAISVKFADSFDESVIAEKIARKVDADHNVVYIENYLEELPKAISIIKEPFWDIHWYHVAKKAKSISKVLVSGDGGDELFGGYTFRYRKFLSTVRSNFSPTEKVKLYLECHERDWVPDQEKIFGSRVKFSWNNIYNLLKAYFDNPLQPIAQVFLADFNGKLLYNWIPLYSKIHKYFGINSLSPILSKEMISHSTHLAYKLKYNYKNDQGKILFRKILSKYKMSPLVSNEKRGFSINTLNLWRSHGYRLCDYYLSDARIVKENLINRDWIRVHISKRYELDVRYVNKFLGLLALEIWFRLFVTKEIKPNTLLN